MVLRQYLNIAASQQHGGITASQHHGVLRVASHTYHGIIAATRHNSSSNNPRSFQVPGMIAREHHTQKSISTACSTTFTSSSPVTPQQQIPGTTQYFTLETYFVYLVCLFAPCFWGWIDGALGTLAFTLVRGRPLPAGGLLGGCCVQRSWWGYIV